MGTLAKRRGLYVVAPIVERVRREGDGAVRHFTKELDGVAVSGPLRVTPEESERASEVLSKIAGDADPKIADGARWSLENTVDMEVLERVGMVKPKKM